MQPKSELLRALQSNLRIPHHSLRTEGTYLARVRRFVRFHRLRHPEHLCDPEVAAFLGCLATDWRALAATLNQALAALQLLYPRAAAGHGVGLSGRPVPRSRHRRLCRHHLQQSALQRAAAAAARASGLSQLSPFPCDPPLGVWGRHPDGAGAARARRCLDDDAVHPRAESGSVGRPEPARPGGAGGAAAALAD